MKEELGLAQSDDVILECTPLFKSSDRRVSGSFGVLSDYEYNVHAVRLKSNHPKVSAIFTDAPTVTIHYHDADRIHRFRWLEWDELLREPHLLAHTPDLVRDLAAKVKPGDLPITFSRPAAGS